MKVKVQLDGIWWMARVNEGAKIINVLEALEIEPMPNYRYWLDADEDAPIDAVVFNGSDIIIRKVYMRLKDCLVDIFWETDDGEQEIVN